MPAQPASRRVVVTGVGLICPLGQTPDELWQGLSEGRSGVRAVAAGSLPVGYAAEASTFTGEIGDFGELEGEKKKAIRKGLKLMCRESQMGVAAAQRAIHQAGLASGSYDPERVGCVYGSDYMVTDPTEFMAGIQKCRVGEDGFNFAQWATDGMTQMSPLWLLKYLPNMPASHIAIYNDLRGPSNSLTHREAASNLAVGEAFRIIARGHADIMIAGATGTRVHPMKSIHAALQEELATNGASPAVASRPFDLNRSGMVLGEGAGTVVLESLESAQARGAKILAEIVGAGSSMAADRRLVARRGDAMANAMRSALRDADTTPDQVGHIQAHGLSTRRCDIDEAQAIGQVFGSRPVPVTAAKSYFGNLGAGSGMVELIAGILALEHGRLFPILNYQTPDAECAVAAVTGHDTPAGDSFLNLNVTPQGQAGCVLVRRFAM